MDLLARFTCLRALIMNRSRKNKPSRANQPGAGRLRSKVPSNRWELHPDLLDDAIKAGVLVSVAGLYIGFMPYLYFKSSMGSIITAGIVVLLLLLWYDARFSWYRYLSWVYQTVEPQHVKVTFAWGPQRKEGRGIQIIIEDEYKSTSAFPYQILCSRGERILPTTTLDAKIYCDPITCSRAVLEVGERRIYFCDSHFLPPS